MDASDASGEPPACAAVRGRKGKGPGAETIALDLDLRNPRPGPRWHVLRADLALPLRASFRALVVQARSFERAPSAPGYLELQGEETGLLAFLLAPGASARLEGFAARSLGPPVCELWEVERLLLDGAPAEAAVGAPLLVEGALRIPDAWLSRPCVRGAPSEAQLRGVVRWELPLG